MGSRYGAAFRHLLILLCFLAAAACSKGGSEKGQPSTPTAAAPAAQGGYDWGSGKAKQSSPELVRRTIEIAQSMMGEPNHEKNIFKDFFLWHARSAGAERGLDLGMMFPKYWHTPGFQPEVISQSPAYSAMARKKLTLLESGDCPRRADEPIADASVSKHTLDAEVCLSIGNLTKHAPSDLARQVMALMLHETIHLAGGDETQAKLWQDEFIIYFGSRFGEMIGEAYLESVGGRIYSTVTEWVYIEHMTQSKVALPMIFSRAGKVYGQLQEIPGILDPIAIQLRLSLKSATSANAFVQKLKNLMTAIDEQFYLEKGPFLRTLPEYDKLLVEVRRQQTMFHDMWMLWEKLEREALCDDDGYFLQEPKAFVVSDTCRSRTPKEFKPQTNLN